MSSLQLQVNIMDTNLTVLIATIVCNTAGTCISNNFVNLRAKSTDL